MNIYTHKLERKVAYDKVPPGKRKPRRVEEPEILEINIAMPEKEEEFPLAYTVYQKGSSDDSRYMAKTPYRAVIDRMDHSKFRLYIPCTKYIRNERPQPICVGSSEFDALISREIEDNDYLDEIMNSIDSFQWNHAIYDGILWKIASEPIYTFECGFNSLYVSIDSAKYCNRAAAYKFRADEKNLIINRIRKAAEKYEDGANDAEYWLAWFNQNHIEIENVFCTSMQTFDIRVMEELAERVHNELKKAFGELYMPDYKKAPGLQRLQDKLVSRIWNDSAYQKNGYVLYDEIYAEAMAKEICELYSEPYLCEEKGETSI